MDGDLDLSSLPPPPNSVAWHLPCRPITSTRRIYTIEPSFVLPLSLDTCENLDLDDLYIVYISPRLAPFFCAAVVFIDLCE